MKTYLNKIINFIKNSNIYVIVLTCLCTGFIIPLWVSVMLATFIFICYFGIIIYSNTNNVNKIANEKDNINNTNTKCPTQWCYIDKADNQEYQVRIFYDNFDNKYRIIEINSNLIFGTKFFSSSDAMEFIKKQAKGDYILGINEYNCVGNLIKK